MRSGTHCTQPLMSYLGLDTTCRVSVAPYNTAEDIDYIIDALRDGPDMIVKTVLNHKAK